MNQQRTEEQVVQVLAGPISLEGILSVPANAHGVVLFAHGSGSSRHSPRNQAVARTLQEGALATVLLDLLSAEEEAIDALTRQLRFNIPLLAKRLAGATDWLGSQPATKDLPVGYFGASTGAGAALVAAAQRPAEVGAVVSRGGRPDLAGPSLAQVRAPTLLIVGGNDTGVLDLNQTALAQLPAPSRIEVVPGATHLFEEPGALEAVARLSVAWFTRYLVPVSSE